MGLVIVWVLVTKIVMINLNPSPTFFNQNEEEKEGGER